METMHQMLNAYFMGDLPANEDERSVERMANEVKIIWGFMKADDQYEANGILAHATHRLFSMRSYLNAQEKQIATAAWTVMNNSKGKLKIDLPERLSIATLSSALKDISDSIMVRI